MGQFGVLTTALSWVGTHEQASDNAGWVHLHVGGLINSEDTDSEFVDWINRDLKIGDELKVSVVADIAADEPVERKPLEKEPYCSFCGQPESEVSKIIVAQQVSICNECVGVCNQVLANNQEPNFGGSAA
ncbi:MAG TPA: ClpX C4-type zinc finger protein [Pyrinomonadaceae bacterium]